MALVGGILTGLIIKFFSNKIIPSEKDQLYKDSVEWDEIENEDEDESEGKKKVE